MKGQRSYNDATKVMAIEVKGYWLEGAPIFINVNSLPTNDAYMRHEILYAKRPMTHIRVMTNYRSLTAKLHSREIPTLNIGVIMN